MVYHSIGSLRYFVIVYRKKAIENANVAKYVLKSE